MPFLNKTTQRLLFFRTNSLVLQTKTVRSGSPATSGLLRQMSGNQLGHLKHADLLFAVENCLQCVVRIDEGFLLGVLKLVLLDVFPKLLGKLSTRKRFRADNGRKDLIG